MNKKLKKQIKAYAGIAGVILASEKTNAQVIYHDFNPDTLFFAPNNAGTVYFNLDVNSDSIPDFQFIAKTTNAYTSTTYGCTGGRLMLAGLGSNRLINANSYCELNNSFSNVKVVKRLNAGDLIDVNGFFKNGNILRWDGFCDFQSWNSDCGVWFTGADNCAGFKLKKNGHHYFGWIRIEILSRSSCLIKEFAYQSQHNVPILACDTTNLPLASITPQGPLSFCVGDSVLLSANPGAGLSYQWTKNGIAISGATAENYIATAAGTYRVVVTNSGGSNTSAPVIVTTPCSPTIDPIEKTGMEISTNISEYNQTQFIFSQQNNSIHISSFQKLNHTIISVYDLLGKEILQQPYEGKETTIKIDKKGIYFVEVKSEKGISRKKIFIY